MSKKKTQQDIDSELKQRVLEEEDFIYSPKYGNSLEEFLKKHDDGTEESLIARVLLMETEEVEDIYQEAVDNLRDQLEVDVD